ncbi:MAG: peptidylprolyl isomerase [Chitinophagaceae bacterium]|nr:peptidylprolyl isomerase [Chitinophagaceae bacterium]
MKNLVDTCASGRALKLMVLFVLFSSSLTAQTLFTCDGRDVSKEDFLKAYNKNNTGEKTTERSYRDYLELYIRFKLKVRAAYDMLLDTLPGQRAELQNFRNQVADSYLKDEASLDKLVNEVFSRGQKDIHLAHIFIAVPAGTDTTTAYGKALTAYNALKKGKKFTEAALQWSEDPAVKGNGGDIGYITVFSLPYELETLAYSTPVGQVSKPYHSKGGYHIFKNLGERKSLGKMRAAQILISIPPGASASVREEYRRRADSLYAALQKGAEFSQLARSYSGDNLSYQSGGELPEFSVGRYDSAFEAAAFALERDGAISRPVATTFGYHIIRRLGRTPFPHELNETVAADLKQQVGNDARAEVSRQALLKRIYQQTGMRRADVPETDLWGFTDSIMTNPGLNFYRNLSHATILFSFPEQQYTVQNWLDHVRTIKASGRARNVSDKALFEQFVGRTALDYYRNHLEQYNKDFAFQLTEFKEGNLLFEVMQRKIWDKASTDSAGLHTYYEAHKDKYWWENSADALLFTCSNEQTAQTLRTHLAASIYDWRKWSDSAAAGVQADSGRYELAQIPALEKTTPGPHQFTPMITSKSDNSISFAYILNVYQGRSPRDYKDARGFVINDYQTYLEDEWIATLKKKYQVNVDERVFASLPK